MADSKLSALTAASALAATDELLINNGGTSKKVTAAILFTKPTFPDYTEYTAIADPATPGAGLVRVYARSLGGRIVPRWVGPSGLDTAYQPAFFANNVTMWVPGVGTTAAISFGVSWTVGATQAHPTIANTNFMTQMKRATFTTTTTAANGSGTRSAAPICWRGNAAGQGGFFFAARCGILTYQSAMRILFGLSGLTTALAGNDPSAVADTCGLSKDTGETTWQALTRSSSTATKISSGRTTAAAGTAEVFDFYMFCKPNDSQISFRLVDITTGTVLIDNQSTTTNLPTNTTMLTAHADCVNVTGGAGTACAIFLNKLYIESDT